MKTFVLVAFISFCTGCAPTSSHMLWVKSGADEAVYSQDRSSCLAQAQESGSSSVDTGLFSECMKKKSWSLQASQKLVEPTTSVSKPMQETLDALKQEKEKRCQSVEYKSFFLKTACDPQNVTSVQMADPEKITVVEKKEALQLNSEMQRAQNKAVEAYQQYGGETGQKAARLLESWRVFNEKNITDLTDGKQTWGQYNRNRKDLYAQLEAELNRSLQS